MTNKFWLGDGSANLFNVAGNWTPSGVPGASDVAIFDDKANNRDCNFDLTTGSSITVGEIIIESNYGGILHLQTVPVIKGLYLAKADGIRGAAHAAIDFRQGGSGSEYGSYKSFNNRFVMIADGGSFSSSPAITLNMYGGSVVTKFDDGDHQTVVLKSGSFAPNYVAPTGTSGKTTFTAFTADDGITFQPTGNLVDNDRLKHFDFGAFTYSDDLFNAGAATCEFKATSGGFVLPITGSAGYGQSPSTTPTDFVSYMRKVILNADTAGHKVLIADNNYVSLEELEVGDGVMLLGPTALTAQGADIRLVNAPKIRGSWSFSQISQGVYRSPRHASGPMPKVAGNFHITGKLNVDGLIDPTGLELTPVSTNPGGTAANTIWIDSDDSKLYFGSTDLTASGGGSGDIEGITTASNSGLAGGATTGTPSLTLDINNLTAEDIASGDMIAFNDAGDNGIHKESIDDIATLFAGTGLSASSAVLSVDLNEVGAITPAVDDNIILTDTNAANATKKAPVADVVIAGMAGAPISTLTNDANFLDANTTPTANFCQWNDIDADITASGVGSNTLINNWDYTTGSTAIRDAMSSGVWTCTAPLAGTYLIISKIQFKSGTLSESAGVNYKLQNLNYWNDGGGTPSSGTLSNFARHMNADFYIGYILETQFILTIADTDTFGVYAKIATSSGSGNFKIASGANAMTSLTMIKIA